MELVLRGENGVLGAHNLTHQGDSHSWQEGFVTEISTNGGIKLFFNNALQGQAPLLTGKDLEAHADVIHIDQNTLEAVSEETKKSGNWMRGKREETKVSKTYTAQLPQYNLSHAAFYGHHENRHVGPQVQGNLFLKNEDKPVELDAGQEHSLEIRTKKGSNMVWQQQEINQTQTTTYHTAHVNGTLTISGDAVVERKENQPSIVMEEGQLTLKILNDKYEHQSQKSSGLSGIANIGMTLVVTYMTGGFGGGLASAITSTVTSQMTLGTINNGFDPLKGITFIPADQARWLEEALVLSIVHVWIKEIVILLSKGFS